LSAAAGIAADQKAAVEPGHGHFKEIRRLSTRSVEAAAAVRPWRQWIGGRQEDALSGETVPVVCPSDGRAFASVPASGRADVGRAVAAARSAFDEGPWGRMPAVERGRLLTRLGLRVEASAAALAALESRDTGKPLTQGKADVAAVLRFFEFYGGAGDKIHGQTIPFLPGYTALTLREPHGVVAGIIPWNYPMQILARVLGAALAMGNTLVVKPAEDAALSTLRIAELALEAGFPEGVFNVVTGYGQEAGAALAGHPGVDYVTFTGSPPTGTAIQQGSRQQSWRHHGARRQVAADRLRRCRPRSRASSPGRRHHTEWRPDLLGRQPRID
jgi:aldehyde dehydrogenase (NAD+)